MSAVNAPTGRPSRKIVAATLGGAIATIIVFVIAQFGIELNDAVSAAIVVIVTALLGYLVPNAESDVV